MRVRFAVLVAVTSVLTVVSPAAAGHPSGPVSGPSSVAGHTAVRDWLFVRHELFGASLAQFVDDARHGDPWYDWSNDGCSAPLLGNTGRSFNFRDPCRRHDFGYRNLRLLEHRYGLGRTYWNASTRRRVDLNFLGDMRAHCRTRSILLRPSCFLWAQTYYTAVRAAGGP